MEEIPIWLHQFRWRKARAEQDPRPVGSARGQDVGVLGGQGHMHSNRLKFIGSNCAGKYVRKRLLELDEEIKSLFKAEVFSVIIRLMWLQVNKIPLQNYQVIPC